MFDYFCMPYEEEIFYSMLSRHSYYSRSLSYQKLTQKLFGKTLYFTGLEFADGLDYLCSEINNDNVTSDYFIRKHTLFPIYEPFLPTVKKEEIINIMRGKEEKIIYTQLGINTGQIKTNKSLFYCPCCMKEDLAEKNEMYFHRVHQFKGVLTCPYHGCLVREYSSVLKRKSEYQFIKINKDSIDFSVEYEKAERINDLLLKVSKAVQYLLENNLSAFNSKDVHEKYLSILSNKGLIHYNGKVKTKELRLQIKNFYGNDFLDKFNLNFLDDDESSWVRKITTLSNSFIHPLKHILFIIFLFDDVNKFFTEKIKTEKIFGNGPWPCLNPICSNYTKDVIQENRIKSSINTKKPLGIFECTCGFKYTRIGPDVDGLHKNKINSINEFGLIWKERLASLVEEKKYTIAELSRFMGFDRSVILTQASKIGILEQINTSSNIYYYESHHAPRKNVYSEEALEEYRNDILKCIKQNPHYTRQEVVRKLVFQYRWLYKFDREWLYLNIKESREEKKDGLNKLDYTKIDIDFVEKLKVAHNELLESKKPIRITKSLLLKKVGFIRLTKDNEKHFHKSLDYINSITETLQQFNCRKIDKICKEFFEDGVEYYNWNVIKKATIGINYNKKYVIERIEENRKMHQIKR